MKQKIERARTAFRNRAWLDAYRDFSVADGTGVLSPQDLECFSTAAYLSGRQEESLAILERAHQAWLESGNRLRAVRMAFWIGLHFFLRGQGGPGSGWIGRAKRLLSQHPEETVEKGYLLIPVAEQGIESGDHKGAASTAGDAASIGERFDDADLTAIARHVEGRALLGQSRVQEGLALLDEAMVAVTADDLSPVVTGLIYCSVIQACQQVQALKRAGEWNEAMARWCESQPQMTAFTGICLVHRSQILQLRGAWPDALAEAERACRGYSEGKEDRPPATAFYQKAEVHRLRGEFADAEKAYREASQWGCDPQPGLALLRLAGGETQAAAAAIRRAVTNAKNPIETARLLPASVEILLAEGDLEGAREAAKRLGDVAGGLDTLVMKALVSHCRGAVALTAGDPHAASRDLRVARESWQELDAPYPAARSRELLGLACRAVGDEDGARLELEAARDCFARLGASPDLARARKHMDSARDDGDRTGQAPGSSPVQILTPRELQVLRLVAAGKTNKAIAGDLGLSERTVDRHLSNILTKLDVPSRAAATAYAYEHDLFSG